MKKEITINFSYVSHEYLVRFFEDGLLVKWKVLGDSKDVQTEIAKFYFPN